MAKLLEFLTKLDLARISYDLGHVRDSIMVTVAIPGELWEIEFFEDGHLEVDRFISTGTIEGEEGLEAMIEANTS